MLYFVYKYYVQWTCNVKYDVMLMINVKHILYHPYIALIGLLTAKSRQLIDLYAYTSLVYFSLFFTM